MLQENLIKIYETSFRDNREMPALTDYFKGETFSYYNTYFCHNNFLLNSERI